MSATDPVRKVFIALARKRQQTGAGSTVAFLRERTARMEYPDLSLVLEGVLWAVVGAAATRLYMPERVTRHYDVLVRAEDAAETRRRLEQGGFSYTGELTIGGSSWLSPEQF